MAIPNIKFNIGDCHVFLEEKPTKIIGGIILNIKNEAKSIQSQIIKWRRDLHSIPEIGFELSDTIKYICKVLEHLGIEYKKVAKDTGIVAIIKGSTGEKVIALRADMDAIKIKEETGLPYASVNSNMHACGHDAHVAMMLGAAKILNRLKGSLKGSIKIIFQPDEEGSNGAKLMIKDGVLENPKVNVIIGLHIGQISKEVGCGYIGVRVGELMASNDKFKILVTGKGCHGAMPDTGVDSILTASHIVVALQSIVSRELNPINSAVITVGRFSSGTQYNIIPGFAQIEGTVRTYKPEDRKFILQRIGEVAELISKSMRATSNYEVTLNSPVVKNDREFTLEFIEVAKKIVGKDKIIFIEKPIMAGEDMGYYLNEVPGTFFFLGAFNKSKGITYPHHNSKFDIDEDVLWIGTAVLAQSALNYCDYK